MDIFCGIFDLLLGVVNLVSFIYDIVAYIESKENRKARKEAMRLGQPGPEIGKWTRRFYILSAIVIIISLYFILRRLIR